MITSKQCYDRYGHPQKENNLSLLPLVEFNRINPAIPKRVYCNDDMQDALWLALMKCKDLGILNQIKTWDGCFCIRLKRGLESMSLHSWALAVDINADTNGLGRTPTMPTAIVMAFESSGFEWGGRWSRPDGMHFQLAKLP